MALMVFIALVVLALVVLSLVYMCAGLDRNTFDGADV